MTADIWIALAAANFAASLAPGQNVALVGSATARDGVRGGAAAISGILLAEAIWSAVAVALILKARAVDPDLLLGLQAAGGIALVWCGMRIVRAAAAGRDAAASRSPAGPLLLLEGLWIGLANPLALMFFVSLLPSLLGAGAAAPGPREAAICVVVIVGSSFAALVPYLAASTALVRAGLASGLNALSGTALLLVGLVVFARVAV